MGTSSPVTRMLRVPGRGPQGCWTGRRRARGSRSRRMSVLRALPPRGVPAASPLLPAVSGHPLVPVARGRGVPPSSLRILGPGCCLTPWTCLLGADAWLPPAPWRDWSPAVFLRARGTGSRNQLEEIQVEKESSQGALGRVPGRGGGVACRAPGACPSLPPCLGSCPPCFSPSRCPALGSEVLLLPQASPPASAGR